MNSTRAPSCGQHEAVLCVGKGSTCVRWCAVRCIIHGEYLLYSGLIFEEIRHGSVTFGAVGAFPIVTGKNVCKSEFEFGTGAGSNQST